MHFPKTKFVAENSISDQIAHLSTEYREVVQEMNKVKRDNFALATELMDVIGSAETALNILQEDFDISIEAVKEFVYQKNMKRGYYEVPEK